MIPLHANPNSRLVRMASPVIKSVGALVKSPRSPVVGRTLSYGLNSSKSPDAIQAKTKLYRKVKQSQASNKFPLGSRLSVDAHLHNRPRSRGSYGCTPLKSSNIIESPPTISFEFEPSRECDALVQSPFRQRQYSMQRRKLYHQDSPKALLARAVSETCFSSPENETEDLVPPPDRKYSMGPLCNLSFGVGEHENSVEDVYDTEGKFLTPSRKNSRKGSSLTSTTPFSATPKLGMGGFGSVRLGKYAGQLVAIKQLYTRDEANKKASFFSELRNFYLQLGSKPHPNIVHIITFDAVHNQLVLEYVGSRNLQQALNNPEESFDIIRRHAYVSQIADALRYCHSMKLLHLDVKPTNILLTDDSDTFCKLGDFGCSRNFGLGTPTTYKHAGTLLYTAPEVLLGGEPTTAADIYSLSLVMWQCLSRQMPFGDNHGHYTVFQVVSAHLRPDCTKLQENLTNCKDLSLLKLAQKCWVHKSELRPSASELCKSLKDLSPSPVKVN